VRRGYEIAGNHPHITRKGVRVTAGEKKETNVGQWQMALPRYEKQEGARWKKTHESYRLEGGRGSPTTKAK